MIITENSKVFLSICIPTFNRADKTANLIKSILLYKGTDIEVIVLDNCSTDDTQNTLKNIQDERFVYIQNETNIGSMPNVLKSLSLGKGKFVMLCLDKDFILYENLPLFIQKLKSFDNVSVGHCSLNYEKFENDTTSDKGLDSLLNIAYTSEHPSGIFLNNRILQKESIISKVYGSDKTFAFNTEILKSEMCVFGNAKRVNIPLVFTEKLEDCEKEVSHTYKGDNIYFFPKNIQKTFNVYINNLFELNISQKEKIAVLKKIFLSLLMATTFGFKEIMGNKSICAHHSILTKDVTTGELLSYAIKFSKSFLSSKIQISFFDKIIIFISGSLKMMDIIFKSKLKNIINKSSL